MKLQRLTPICLFIILSITAACAAESQSWLSLTQGAGQALDKQDLEAASRYNYAALVELEEMAKKHQHIHAVKPNSEFMHLHILMMNLTNVYSQQVIDLTLKRLDDIRGGTHTNLTEINETIARVKDGLRKQREAAYDPKLTPEQQMDAVHKATQELDRLTEENRAAYRRAEARSNQAELLTVGKIMSAQKQIADLEARLTAAYIELLGPKHELTLIALKDKKQAEDEYAKYAKEYQDIQGGSGRR